MQRRAALKVTRIGGDQAAAPLPLGKTNPEARRCGNPFQRDSSLRLDPVDHARGEDRERLAVDVARDDPIPIGDAGQPGRARHQPAERRSRAHHPVSQLWPLPQAQHRFLAQRFAALLAVLEDLARQRNVDWADLLACVALGAERVGQVGGFESVVKRREDQPDRTVVDVAELVAAHGHEGRAHVGARAAADAGQRLAKQRVGSHLFAAVVEDHAMHLARSVHADGQRLLDVG